MENKDAVYVGETGANEKLVEIAVGTSPDIEKFCDFSVDELLGNDLEPLYKIADALDGIHCEIVANEIRGALKRLKDNLSSKIQNKLNKE